MSDPVDFHAVFISVSVTSVSKPAWNFAMSAQGNIPPGAYSIRGGEMIKVTNKLVELRKELGEPPPDLERGCVRALGRIDAERGKHRRTPGPAGSRHHLGDRRGLGIAVVREFAHQGAGDGEECGGTTVCSKCGRTASASADSGGSRPSAPASPRGVGGAKRAGRTKAKSSTTS